MRTSEIKFNVTLDDENLPEKMTWQASETDNAEPVGCKAFMISLWDGDFKNTLKIDLWTKDMPVDEMKQFFYEALMTMGDTFEKATGEKLIVEDLRDYCAHFAEKMQLKMPS